MTCATMIGEPSLSHTSLLFFFFSTTQNCTCQGSGKSCVHKLSFVLFLSMSKLIEKYECHSKLYLPQSRHDHIEARKDTCSPLYHAVSFGFLKHEHHSRLLDLSSSKIQSHWQLRCATKN